MELRPYGATAAREHGKSGAETRPSRLTIDAHCHLHVQEAHDLVDGILNPMAIPAVRYSNPRTTAQNVKQNQEDRIVHLTDLDQRLRDMDRQGIDMQVLIPVPFLSLSDLGTAADDCTRSLAVQLSERSNLTNLKCEPERWGHTHFRHHQRILLICCR